MLLLRTIDRHLFFSTAKMVGSLVLLALCVLLLERSLRIIEITSASPAPLRDATRLMLNLIPHYLGLAFPAALMIGTIARMSSLSRLEQITALLSTGYSLVRIARPFLVLALLLAIGSLIVEGYLQPLARYSYREAAHLAKQETVVGAFQRGEFVSFGDRTSFVRNVGENGEIEDVFIYERTSDGGVRVLTAPAGLISLDEETRQTGFRLARGVSVEASREGGVYERVDFDRLATRTDREIEMFRSRGNDERELTMGELLRGEAVEALPEEERDDAAAAFHFRAGRAAAILFFPLLAVPLGLVSNRSNQSGGVALGLLYLVVIQKLFEAGQGAAAAGAIPPWAGAWPVVLLVAVTSGALFWRSAYTLAPPPMETLTRGMTLPKLRLPFGRMRSA
ncbi:LptF/LptG family permease [Parvularcula maris]|uniref:LptF/LptG family permease n=1 Tax=Parvularcula maris TaxID=2965077 RepID=A0A9X2RJV9_9PROT|nr:LptF/LptG family permease [Parvularcula maris]MCQ8186331.1 LptF/LptG family permease [Parvularcula maris]